MTKKITLKKLKELQIKADKYLNNIYDELYFDKAPKKFKHFPLQDIYDIHKVMCYFNWIPVIYKLDSDRLNLELRKAISIMEDFDTTAREDLIPMWAWKFVEDAPVNYELVK